MIKTEHFEWDPVKDAINQIKHGVSFLQAQQAFMDPKCVLAFDKTHSLKENRFYGMGEVNGEVLTVRFTYRNHKVRIFGAGYWRRGKKEYEKKNQIHRF